MHGYIDVPVINAAAISVTIKIALAAATSAASSGQSLELRSQLQSAAELCTAEPGPSAAQRIIEITAPFVPKGKSDVVRPKAEQAIIGLHLVAEHLISAYAANAEGDLELAEEEIRLAVENAADILVSADRSGSFSRGAFILRIENDLPRPPAPASPVAAK